MKNFIKNQLDAFEQESGETFQRMTKKFQEHLAPFNKLRANAIRILNNNNVNYDLTGNECNAIIEVLNIVENVIDSNEQRFTVDYLTNALEYLKNHQQ